MHIKFIEDRALEVFTTLNLLWEEKKQGKGIFKDVVLSQDRWPEPKDRVELANYLACAALFMRGGVISDDPFKWLYALQEKVPEMFDPKVVAEDWTPKRIESTIRKITPKLLNKEDAGTEENGAGALGFNVKTHTISWQENLTTLHNYWGDNVLNVFWGVTEFEEAFRRIDHKRNIAGFKGMRRKIFSLLTIWLQERELIPVFPTPIPIDHHALRVLLATNSIEVKDHKVPTVLAEKYEMLADQLVFRRTEQLVDDIMKWSQSFLIKHGLSYLNVNPAIWVLSRDFCSGQLQNTSRQDGKFYFTPEILRENPNLWPKKYRDPCSYCPLEHLCTGVVPVRPHSKNALVVRMERVPYPNPMLSGFGKQLPYPGRRKSVK